MRWRQGRGKGQDEGGLVDWGGSREPVICAPVVADWGDAVAVERVDETQREGRWRGHPRLLASFLPADA